MISVLSSGSKLLFLTDAQSDLPAVVRRMAVVRNPFHLALDPGGFGRRELACRKRCDMPVPISGHFLVHYHVGDAPDVPQILHDRLWVTPRR